jgi:hypothetical protein
MAGDQFVASPQSPPRSAIHVWALAAPAIARKPSDVVATKPARIENGRGRIFSEPLFQTFPADADSPPDDKGRHSLREGETAP